MADDWQSDPTDYLGNIVGSPVTISSGFRTPQQNALVGGVPNSAHLTGQAYDFVPKGITTAQAAAKLAQSGIPFDQVIDEGDHVHISFAPTNRRQVIGQKVADNSMTADDMDALVSGSLPPESSREKVKPQGTAKMAVTVSPPPVTANDMDNLVSHAAAPQPAVPAPATTTPDGQPAYGAQPFGLQQEIQAHIPFVKDVAAGVPALLDAAIGRGSVGSNYQTNLAAFNAAQQAYEQQNPIASKVGAGMGFLAAGGPAESIEASGIRTLGQLMKSGARGGATIGGLFGLGTPAGTNESLGDRLEGGAFGAATGATFGGLLPVLGAGVAAGGRVLGRAANRLIPSAAESAANRAKAIIEHFAGGDLDPNPTQIVPGSKPTLAESVKNPGVSILQKQLTQLNPNSPLVTRAAQNAQARLESLEKITGTKADLEALTEERDAAAQADLKEVFSRPRNAVITPVLSKIKEIEEGSGGQRPAVAKAMKELRELLGEGTTKDAETLYNSVRKGIGDLIDGKDPTKAHGLAAMREILQVRDVLDKVIDHSAKGFKKYLEDYSESSGPVTSMKYLQGLNLTDAQGNITLQKVQTAIKNILKQQSMPGKREAKAITEAQLSGLRSIRDDLLRQTNLDLNKARGSDTVQNLMAQKRLGFAQRILPEGIGATVGAGLGHLVGGTPGAEMGGFLGDRLGAAVGKARAAREQQSQNLLQSTLEEMLLNPEKYHAPMSGIPSRVRPLNDILSGPGMRKTLGVGNRLLIPYQASPKQASR